MSKQKGFTMIEIMIALGLLAIGLLAIGSAEITLLTQSKRSTDTMKATAAAESMIALMRRNSNAIIAYGGMNTANPVMPIPGPQVNFDFNSWRTQVGGITAGAVGTIVVGPSGVMPGSRPVVVSVAWPVPPPPETIPRTMTFATSISCPLC